VSEQLRTTLCHKLFHYYGWTASLSRLRFAVKRSRSRLTRLQEAPDVCQTPASHPLPRCPLRLIGLAVVLAVSLILVPLTAQAQAGKLYRVGVIVSVGATTDVVGPDPRNANVAALLRGLRDLGYVYGRDFVTEPRSTKARIERSRAIAAELAGLPVDVIVAAGPSLPGVKQAGITTRSSWVARATPSKTGSRRVSHAPAAALRGSAFRVRSFTASGYSYSQSSSRALYALPFCEAQAVTVTGKRSRTRRGS
jgi:hypothetical protein